MWKHFVKETILKPVLQRLGTIGASALVFGGEWLCVTFDACGLVTQDGADMVLTYVCAVALLCFDLAMSHFDRMAKKGR